MFKKNPQKVLTSGVIKQLFLNLYLYFLQKKRNMKQLLISKLPMLVQEDKPPTHASKYQDEIFQLYDIL